MIHTERTKHGVKVAMQGNMNDIVLELSVAMSHVLKLIPEEQRVGAMAEMSVMALEHVDDSEGEGVAVSDPDVLLDAIEKTTGGKDE